MYAHKKQKHTYIYIYVYNIFYENKSRLGPIIKDKERQKMCCSKFIIQMVLHDCLIYLF